MTKKGLSPVLNLQFSPKISEKPTCKAYPNKPPIPNKIVYCYELENSETIHNSILLTKNQT